MGSGGGSNVMKRLVRFLASSAICAATILLWAPNPTHADSFTIEQWGFTVSVDNGWPDLAAATFHSVQNPFINQHAVTLPSNPATMAAAQYDVSWLVNYGSFNISAQLAAQDGNFVDSLASGTIYLHTETDLSLHLNAAFAYNLPGSGQLARIYFRAVDRDTEETFLNDLDAYDTDISPPGPGTLTLSGDTILPAGRNYRLQYSMRLLMGGSSSTLADGSGSMSFTITPEASTLTLLAPLLFVVSRRALRHRRALPA
jgi:hypothetical protein